MTKTAKLPAYLHSLWSKVPAVFFRWRGLLCETAVSVSGFRVR